MSDPIFQKSLQDLVKGIRSHKKDPSPYISQAIAEIKTELKSVDPFLKSEAVRKLTYLQMVGYNISWAAFSIIEVMSQTRFAHKRIGYLAANQSFTETTDVILLTTNLFKKELSSGASLSQYEIGLALNCLANIVTKDLARDCISDVVSLMNHTRPYVRKKAILTLYKMFIKFPQGLRLTFERLKERLDDSESSVISCAVNVICELANKNPKNYLAMAPKFFRLLTTSSNNWMLIKVVKLMGSLVTEEPRLARKLLEPLTTIIQNTGAKSLQYECIQTITESLLHTKREDGSDAKNVPAIVKLCSDYLRGFIEEHDQNLKYLGLVGLVNLLRSHPRQVVEHREIILRCLNDDDNTIRVRALELLAGIVSKKSLVDLVHHLLEHAKRAEGSYRDEIISKVLYMCSKEKYNLVTDFAWYVSVLLDLAVMQGSKHGKEVANQLIDVALRVDSVRPFAVESMLSLLLNEKLILGVARQTVCEVLKAAAWIVGEYSHIVTNIANDTADDNMIEQDENAGYWIEGPSGEDIRSLWRGQDIHAQVIDALLNPRATNLPPPVQCTYIQAAMKVFIRACADRDVSEVALIIGTLRSRLIVYLQSQHIEVQERASTLRYMLSEFGILSLDWESTAKKSDDRVMPTPSPEIIVAESMKPSASSYLVDLLDPSASINTQVAITKPVDEDGARQAKLKAKVLLTAIAEPFYAVHSKAQRKVPVPEGLSLQTPIKESALHKLLQVEIPENLTISSLYFIPVAPSMNFTTNHNNYDNDDDLKPSAASAANDKASLYTSFLGDNAPKFSSASSGVPSSLAPLPPPRNPDENLFYLSASSNISRDPGIIPLSQTLAETFEEDKKSKKKDKKHKKEKTSSTASSSKAMMKNMELDKRELLPAGAVSSDEDIIVDKKRGANRSSHKRVDDVPITRKKGSDEVNLSNIDITTPLRDDEVFVELKHRQVPVSQSKPMPSFLSNQPTILPSNDADDHDDKKKSKKDKKSKKGSEKEKVVKEEKKSKKTTTASEDLLNFDWITPEPSTTAAAANPNPSYDLLSSSFASEIPSSSSTHDKKSSSKSSSSKKSSSSTSWLSLINDPRADIAYSFNKPSASTNANTISISFRGSLRLEPTSRACTIDIILSNVMPFFRFANGSASGMVSLGATIQPGEEATAVIDLVYDPMTFTNTTVLGVTARVNDASINSSMRIYLHNSFMPMVVDPTGFAVIVSKSSNRWGNATARVAFTGKVKSAMKSIAAFLRCHIVEEEYSRAVSLCAKTSSGGEICGLVKASKDASFVTVEIKALCSSRSESVTVAESMAVALNDLKI